MGLPCGPRGRRHPPRRTCTVVGRRSPSSAREWHGSSHPAWCTPPSATVAWCTPPSATVAAHPAHGAPATAALAARLARGRRPASSRIRAPLYVPRTTQHIIVQGQSEPTQIKSYCSDGEIKYHSAYHV